jgi:hypothetical protein
MRIWYACLAVPVALAAAACSSDRSESAPRDLTLLPSASATDAVASARELDLPRAEPDHSNAAGASAMTPVPARVRARPAKPVERAANEAPVVAPDPEPSPESPAPGPRDVASAGGAGMPLEPGQTVTVLPVSGGTGAQPLPASDIATEDQIRRPWIIIGDDRCIPGRGEVMPRGHRGWH